MSRWLCALTLVVLHSLAATALAQDAEPNDTCPGQHIGMPTLPFALDGSLDTPPDVPDVDFFRFDLTPGTELVADLQGEPTGAGTLSDSLLGLFDSNCGLIDVNDDGGTELDSQLIFRVPDDGVVVLAASAFPDFEFTGNGSFNGSYVLEIAEAPPRIHAISGRLVDARDGHPLTGEDPTYAAVSLLRCEESDCLEVGVEIPDAEGRFTFSGELYGLRVGRYHLAATAEGYEEGRRRRSEPFDVSAGEHFEFGDFALEPNQLQIAGVRLCGPLSSEGGVCRYAVQVRNQGDGAFSGRVWSLVDYFSAGAEFAYAFQVGTGNTHVPQPKYVWIEPGETEHVVFNLRVPAAWPALEDGGFACISVGVGRAPFAVHNVVAGAFVGCLTRDAAGFQLQPPNEVRSELKGRSQKSLGVQRMRSRMGGIRRW